MGAKESLKNIKTKTVEDGMELYYQSVGRMNDHIKKKKASAEANIKKQEVVTELSSGKVNVSDLDKAAKDDPKDWFGESVVICNLFSQE